MKSQLEDIASISLDEDSRSARWKKLKTSLRNLAQDEDAIGDKLASIMEQCANLREEALELAEALQIHSDLASIETQREISLTLNDDDYEVVVDTPSSPLSNANIEREKLLSLMT